eukprot:Blabericola_migrator_1__5004@NODE_259_length_10733_cov_186_924620_g217_i0_p3_GENE_NODE_259_length_10733_cov_186_924620_g217_i0NODE_259_length_10733_cov_186_924620_g217_i0_p3_ORF_typecomplete_len547_score86_45Peptidase_S8/PF00082_22/3e17DUF4756/PF15948_5/0_029Peptidase_S8_N/PF16361_5/2_3e02Peptidase_S8_N/PF16361_5/1_3_NODE_259_length_10733_cov_186_924620_g217_i023804020
MDEEDDDDDDDGDDDLDEEEPPMPPEQPVGDDISTTEAVVAPITAPPPAPKEDEPFRPEPSHPGNGDGRDDTRDDEEVKDPNQENSNCCDFEIEPDVPLPSPRPGTRIIRLDPSELISSVARDFDTGAAVKRKARKAASSGTPPRSIIRTPQEYAVDARVYRAAYRSQRRRVSIFSSNAKTPSAATQLTRLVDTLEASQTQKFIVELDPSIKHGRRHVPAHIKYLDELSFAIVDVPANMSRSEVEVLSHTLLMQPDVRFVEPDSQVVLFDSPKRHRRPQAKRFRKASKHNKRRPSLPRISTTDNTAVPWSKSVVYVDRLENEADQRAQSATTPVTIRQECLQLETEEMVAEEENAFGTSLPKIASFTEKVPESETEKLIDKPNDPLWPYQWYLYWVNAHKAWRTHRGDEEGAFRPIICIVDTGIDYTHPDIKANLWVNEAELNGLPGVDDDGNGYVDDIYGINAVLETGDPMDDNSHGTHCAGVAGASGDNKLGIVGVNRKARLMGCKFLGSDGGVRRSFMLMLICQKTRCRRVRSLMLSSASTTR